MNLARWIMIVALSFLAYLASRQDQHIDCAIFIVGAFLVLAIDSAVDSLKEKK